MRDQKSRMNKKSRMKNDDWKLKYDKKKYVEWSMKTKHLVLWLEIYID